MANNKAKVKSKKATAPASKKTVVRTVSAKPKVIDNEWKQLMKKLPVRSFGIEFIGSFAIVSTFMLAEGNPIVLIFALIGIVLGMGGIRNGLFNPILSFGAWVTRKISSKRLAFQLLAQMIGGIAAYFVLTGFYKNAPEVSEQAAMYGATTPTLMTLPAIAAGQELAIMLAEMLGAFMLSFFIARQRNFAGNITRKAVVYGGATFAAIFISGSIAKIFGALSLLNPAMLFTLEGFKTDNMLWVLAIYVAGPLIGGALGYYFADVVTQDRTPVEDFA